MKPPGVGSWAGRGLALVSLLAAASCSWTRFSDVQKNAPNVLLKQPAKLKAGFGGGVAAASFEVTDKQGQKSLQVRLLATGSPGQWGGAVYNLGSSDQPGLDAVDTGHCSEGLCKLAAVPAALPLAGSKGGDLQLCFVSGLMQEQLPDYPAGPTVRCEDDSDYSFAAPPEVKASVIDPAFNPNLGLDPPRLVFGTDHSDRPALVAGVRLTMGSNIVSRAWIYPPEKFAADDTQILKPPGSSLDPGYASAVAVARLHDETRIFAVGAPGTQDGKVWLFRMDPQATTATPVGCLGGPAGFGRTLTSGIVNRDADEDLVVADDQNVSVFSGEALGQLKSPASTQCSLASLPAGALIASFGCGQTPAITGCASSRFGASLAVGDIDGNGDGEVIVGAPDMTVRGTPNAGALLVYDVNQERPGVLSEADFISSAEDGDRLGTSVTTARIAGPRDIIAAGAPGHQKVALFYCSKLLPGDKRGPRCK